MEASRDTDNSILGPSSISESNVGPPPLLTRQVTKHMLNTPAPANNAAGVEGGDNTADVDAGQPGARVSIARGRNQFHPNKQCVNVLMIGTGEYTTGYVNGAASNSDKGAGVVALTMLDLKKRGITGRLGLCGVNGTKFAGIRQHMRSKLSQYAGLSELVGECETWPADNVVDPTSYLQAINAFSPGDTAIIFTPDDTHFDIALACIRRGMHVLVTKPAVKTLEQHSLLHAEAVKYDVLVSVEVHKRWDPMYADARDKIKGLGDFSFLHSYMSQPKHQLATFQAWAGKSSDISYYLNSHHIDFHEWCVGQTSRPITVVAMASTGVAKAKFGMECEDTITLTVEWQNLSGENGNEVTSVGTAVYTSSWIAPKSDVHSQQRFFYMGHSGEVNVDQGHRGYSMSDDSGGYRSVNPLFMKYTPTDGNFSGQNGYGYRSFSAFIDAAQSINEGTKAVNDYAHSLASISTTYRTTCILEAGRRSLDEKRSISIQYNHKTDPCLPTGLT